MKVRDSGMPEEAAWSGFFDAAAVLRELDFPSGGDAEVVDFGCGYGTFAVEAARMTRGMVHALDIDEAMVAKTLCKGVGLSNLRAQCRDFVAAGTGLADASVDYAMLFNILHAELPVPLLQEARRVLRPGGRLAAIHWVSDRPTPRGPDLAIRPRPEQIRRWCEDAGFAVEQSPVMLPPWHFGLSARKPS